MTEQRQTKQHERPVFNDGKPAEISESMICGLLTNGYRLQLVRKRDLHLNAFNLRFNYPLIPCFSEDYKTNLLYVNIDANKDLVCDFDCRPKTLFNEPEIDEFVRSLYSNSDFEAFKNSSLAALCADGLADSLSNLRGGPLWFRGSGIHLAGALRLLSDWLNNFIYPMYRVFSVMKNVTREDVIEFCRNHKKGNDK